MLLTVENLSKEYIKKKTLNNVSFSMEKGEILGMLGKSGAGKSTIGKILLQLSRPTTGTILFEGKALSEVPRRDIQAIFQDPYSALNPSLKIGEILEEPLIANGVFQNKKERRKKVEETLVKVGLLEYDYEKYPEELSGGQQQRVCIAGAIILSPKFSAIFLNVVFCRFYAYQLTDNCSNTGFKIIYPSEDSCTFYK